MSRFVILGVGAIGGTVATLLSNAGREVLGIARGRQLEILREGGLTLRTPMGSQHARFPVAASPQEAGLRPDDVILLCVKTQHTEAALLQLREAGMTDQPLFCLQNGVANERLALRYFPNVHGVTLILPADFVSAGEVVAYGAPCTGLLDIGRFPGGTDKADVALAEALTEAGLPSEVRGDVMASKYRKLLVNLGNIVGAALGSDEGTEEILAKLKAEGEAVMAAAGIAVDPADRDAKRRVGKMKISEVPGVTRVGSSTAQSLARGAGSVETDYLNGEIALLGRLHGVPTPANAWFTELAARLVREGAAPGAVSKADIAKALGL